MGNRSLYIKYRIKYQLLAGLLINLLILAGLAANFHYHENCHHKPHSGKVTIANEVNENRHTEVLTCLMCDFFINFNTDFFTPWYQFESLVIEIINAFQEEFAIFDSIVRSFTPRGPPALF